LGIFLKKERKKEKERKGKGTNYEVSFLPPEDQGTRQTEVMKIF